MQSPCLCSTELRADYFYPTPRHSTLSNFAVVPFDGVDLLAMDRLQTLGISDDQPLNTDVGELVCGRVAVDRVQEL